MGKNRACSGQGRDIGEPVDYGRTGWRDEWREEAWKK